MALKYPFVKIAPIFAAGILLQNFLNPDLYIFISAFVLSVVIYFFYSMDKENKALSIVYNIIILIVILYSGALIAHINAESTDYFPDWLEKENDLKIFGQVEDIKLFNDDGFNFTIRADSVSINNKTWNKRGEVICRVKMSKEDSVYKQIIYLYENLKSGDYITAQGLYWKGKGIRNPGDFDFNQYLKYEGISGILNVYLPSDIKILGSNNDWSVNSFIFNIRKSIAKRISLLHDKQSAALLKGLLLADRTEIDEDINLQFINSGVAHILAVSGLHIGFIVIILLIVSGRMNLWLRGVFLISGIIFFILLTGAPASVVRAGIMSIVIVITFLSNRDSSLLNSIAVSAFIILAVSPIEIYKPGFQLSFAAVISIALIYRHLLQSDSIREIRNPFLKTFILFVLLSLSAQIGTLPFILLYFDKLSLTSLGANLAAIPLSGWIIGNGIFTIIVSYIYLPVAHYFSVSNQLMIELLNYITYLFGSGKWSFIPVYNFSWLNLIFFYSFLLLFFTYLYRFQTIFSRGILLILTTANIYIFYQCDKKSLFPENQLSVMAFDVGQGDAFLIRFPDNKTALIDAGEATKNYDNGTRSILPTLEREGINQIDYAFISHLDKDHFTGALSLIKLNKLKKIYKPIAPESDTLNFMFESFLTKQRTPFLNYEGGIIKLDNYRIYILNNKEFKGNNENSALIQICFGETSFLFTGDINSNVERHYSSKYGNFLRSNWLKVSHHGSKGSSSPAILDLVKPQFAVISAGIRNKYKHPAPEVISRLSDMNSGVYRTDKSGALLFISDGFNIRQANWK